MPVRETHPQPRARKTKAHELVHHRHAGTSGIPCTMVLRLIRALLGVPGLLATVVCELRHPQT
jgi:hypothetical protein